MGVLIDTNIIIDFERQVSSFEQHIRKRKNELFYISVISASELLHGVYRAVTPQIKARRLAFVEAVLDQFPILEIDLTCARIHAQLWSHLAAKGKMVGLHDSWIAASCLAHNLVLITKNHKEFKRIPGLRVETWN